MTQEASRGVHVVVVGGGNAGLCAALEARAGGAQVTILERAPLELRGGNSRHTRNLRTLHANGDGFATGPYLFDEFYDDLANVSGYQFDPAMARLTISESESLIDWMAAHGARWQPSLRGTLSLSRTNHFFLGGGKALLNAYYLTAADIGIVAHYDARVVGLAIDGQSCVGVDISVGGNEPERLRVDAVVIAAGGYEANREWLREGWSDAADTLIVRGTPYNDGSVLRLLLDLGACTVGDATGAHAIAVDARAPLYDAGIITRLDAIPIGIAVNRDARRFSDEGADLWPKRYASWGRLIAQQPSSIAYVLYDEKVAGETIPSLYPPYVADSVPDLARQLGLDSKALAGTVGEFNASCRPGARFDLTDRDDCATDGLTPPKSNWARPLDTPPFYGYPMRPGITFTYLGVAVDEQARVRSTNGRFSNLFAAGEIMAGNVLSQGYLAGFGMTIGSVWGRIAGRSAALVSAAAARA